MAKCERGYLCEVCGQDVAEITESDLYLRYVLGEVPPEVLHRLPERHVRCNPVLAQFIADPSFAPVRCDGPFAKECSTRPTSPRRRRASRAAGGACRICRRSA